MGRRTPDWTRAFYIYGDGSTYCDTDRSVVYSRKGSRYAP
jgi:hypothetical protein